MSDTDRSLVGVEKLMNLVATGSGQGSLAGAAEEICATFVEVPEIGFGLFDRSGTYVAINDACMKMLFPSRAKDEVLQSHLTSLFGEMVATELTSVRSEVLESGRPLMLRWLWRGVQHWEWLQPLNGTKLGACLMWARPGSVALPNESAAWRDVRLAEFVELGPLGSLSQRELETLALIGLGLTSAQIAKRVHRSVRTIENTRTSMAQKLGVRDRVELARLADRAGLHVEDANRLRVRVPA